MQASQDGVGELYTSGVIKAMILAGYDFEALELKTSEICCLGTPLQLKEFSTSYSHQPTLRFAFDFDSALSVLQRDPDGGVANRVPISHTLDYLRMLKRQGHTIIIVACKIPSEADALEWLKMYDVPFDEFQCDTLHYDFRIDGRVVDPFQGMDELSLARQTGIYSREMHSCHTYRNDNTTRSPSLTSANGNRAVAAWATPRSEEAWTNVWRDAFFAGASCGGISVAAVAAITFVIAHCRRL